jgi:hypothetical protein
MKYSSLVDRLKIKISFYLWGAFSTMVIFEKIGRIFATNGRSIKFQYDS